jgi:hypothetical protein
MNWKLIFTLSLFGLAMAVATVCWIPMNIEPIFWLAIFIICAAIISKRCSSRFFQHGFMVSMVNCIWIIAAHVYWYKTYFANHPGMENMGAGMPMGNHTRTMMVVMGILIGAASGIILGLFAVVGAKLRKK